MSEFFNQLLDTKQHDKVQDFTSRYTNYPIDTDEIIKIINNGWVVILEQLRPRWRAYIHS